MMKFLVKQQKIEVLEREIIASDQIAFVSVKFVFDGVWKTLHKVVQFTQCEETYNLVLGTGGTTCLLPAELHPGSVKMSLFGYDAESDTTLRATTVPVTLHIRPSGFVADGDTPIPPTPDLYTQLLKKLDEKAAGLQNGKDGFSPKVKAEQMEFGVVITIVDADGETSAMLHNGANGEKGTDGKSAYQIAVEQGYQGSESDWLSSLKGDKGNTGAKGNPGQDGADGKSAYAIAVEHGYEDSEEKWLLSLKGEKGDTGERGEKGNTGDRGLQGVPGEKGEKGDAGVAGKDGFSPIANVVKDGSVITITITDKNGTTTVTLTEGAAVDLTPYAKVTYVDEKVQELSDSLTYTLQEHTLSITHLEDKSHTHENQSALDQITAAKIAPNLLERDFKADQPNQKWVTDITEFALFGIKLYLSPIIDLYNGEVISYNLSRHPNLNQVTDMLEKAFTKIPDNTNLILHSDQGWQYQHKHYQKMLKEKGIRQSMSRKGNCLDNACAENFFSLLKTELLYLQEFTSVEHFISELHEYIEWYNNKRIKLKLNGLSPVEFRHKAA